MALILSLAHSSVTSGSIYQNLETFLKTIVSQVVSKNTSALIRFTPTNYDLTPLRILCLLVALGQPVLVVTLYAYGKTLQSKNQIVLKYYKQRLLTGLSRLAMPLNYLSKALLF